MRPAGLILSAAMVGVEVFLLVAFGPQPLIVACLVFCSLMFVLTLITSASDR